MTKKTIFSMFLLLAQLVAYAQGGQVKGNVKDSMGEPVIGATVTEAGNPRNATVTDYDGNFVLHLSSKGRQVVVSYVGMKTKTVQATSGTTLSIALAEDANTLGEVEVVSVGYGQARRRDLTGSISSVGEKTLRHITVQEIGVPFGNDDSTPREGLFTIEFGDIVGTLCGYKVQLIETTYLLSKWIRGKLCL